LDDILIANKKKGNQRDDARATADAIQAVANANMKNGLLDKAGFQKDLGKFFIDQKANGTSAALGSFALQGVGKSQVAERLFGGKRVGATGWNSQFHEGKDLQGQNQAHHLAAFVQMGSN
jgi:hypothetical protein